MDTKPKVNPTSSKIWALLFLAVGLVVMFAGYTIVKNREVPKSYVMTQGQVTSSPETSRGNYQLHITFTAKDNKQYSFTSQTPVAQTDNRATTPYSGDETVKVAYNPRNPSAHPINASDKNTPFYAILIAIVGGIFAALGFISIIYQLITRH